LLMLWFCTHQRANQLDPTELPRFGRRNANPFGT
jgi:hypothetical protein